MWVRTEVSFSNDPAAAGGGTDRETGSTSKKQLLPGSELLPDPLDFVRSCSQLSRIDFLVGISVNLTEVGVHDGGNLARMKVLQGCILPAIDVVNSRVAVRKSVLFDFLAL